MKQTPDWFLRRVVHGVQFLMALPLPGKPRHQPVDLVAAAWVDSLWDDGGWDERLDNARLYGAFDVLAARARRWPLPEELLECLRPRAAAAAVVDEPPHARARRRAECEFA
jgi:hypothetical protein